MAISNKEIENMDETMKNKSEIKWKFITLSINTIHVDWNTVEPRLSELIGTASTSDIGNLG